MCWFLSVLACLYLHDAAWPDFALFSVWKSFGESGENEGYHWTNDKQSEGGWLAISWFSQCFGLWYN